MSNYEISIEEFQKWHQEGKKFQLVDVREQWEIDICALPSFIHIPLGTLCHSQNLDDFNLPTDIPLVVLCHHGRRSLQAVYALEEKGYKNAISLQGGIHAWSCEVDASVDTY